MPAPNWVMVVVNGEPSAAEPLAGVAVPLVQLIETGTLAPLFGRKSLFTVNVALRIVLTIVQVPAVNEAEHVPVDVYPSGIGDSVAVQVGLPV